MTNIPTLAQNASLQSGTFRNWVTPTQNARGSTKTQSDHGAAAPARARVCRPAWPSLRALLLENIVPYGRELRLGAWLGLRGCMDCLLPHLVSWGRSESDGPSGNTVICLLLMMLHCLLCMCGCAYSVVSNSLQHTRLLCPWDSPGQEY